MSLEETDNQVADAVEELTDVFAEIKEMIERDSRILHDRIDRLGEQLRQEMNANYTELREGMQEVIWEMNEDIKRLDGRTSVRN